jgi:hypothetical protein
MNLKKKIGKVFTSKFFGTGPSSYEKRIYRAAVSQMLRNTALRYPGLLFVSQIIFLQKESGLIRMLWKERG